VRAFGLFAMLLVPSLASAEVMDKEFGLLAVLGWALLGGVATFCAARWLPWALAIALPPIALFFASQFSELLDPHIGPAMLQEAGQNYVVISWLSSLVVIAALTYGLLVRCRVRGRSP